MHFNEFLNMCEKCLSDTLCETKGVYNNSIKHFSSLNLFII